MKTKHNSQTAAQSMAAPSDLFRKLQKADRKQAALYLFCNFVSLLLITAYSAMMFSPTVLLVLPEGGDSRKQMIAIFVLALFGCVVFTIYASHLFFRKKAKQLGTLMALGASRRWIAPGLFREVITLSGFSSLLGIAAGLPFTCLLWSMFRLFLVNSEEMRLVFDFKCLYLSLVFFLLVVAFSCMTAYRYLKRTNIMDVVHEEHKNEPVKKLGRWCGPAGLLLLFGGAVLGYCAPYIYMNLFGFYYPPAWLNLFYAPVFVGLYLIMLHTVVHGWRSRKKHPYKNIISRSMMKFQGKQTVNNLLVSTVLIAGAAFAIFYLPTLSTGQLINIENRPYGYICRYPDSQKVLSEKEISDLAADYGLTLRDYKELPCLVLGTDGMVNIDDEGNRYHTEYRELLQEGRFLSESSYCALTGQSLTVAPGTYYAVSNTEETGLYYTNSDCKLFTNLTTRETLPVTFQGYVHADFLVTRKGINVLNDNDYEKIARGLSEYWKEHIFVFNVERNDSYTFASALFYRLVDCYEPEYAIPSYYDRVEKLCVGERGETYWGDTEAMTKISFDSPDSTDFRNYWTYMPQIKMLDKNDFARTHAVFLMMFLFISIICILAAMIISYTRCMTIALNNRYVFDDLKRLGASPEFLMKEVKGQSKNVFAVPVGIGTGAMFVLYGLIMFGNDGKLTGTEAASLGVCLLLVGVFGIIFYLVYLYTVKRMCRELEIAAPAKSS